MKKIVYLLTLVLCLIVVVGCGKKTTTEPVDQELYPEKDWTMLQAKHNAPIEITIWVPNSATSSMGEAVSDLVELYNQQQEVKYPGKNITVNVEFQGTSGALNTKLQAAILAGNNPVISIIGVSSVPLYVSRSIDLRTVYTYDEIGQFNEGLLQYSLYGGKFMLNPYFASASNIIVANKTLVSNKGLTLPTPDSIISNPNTSNWTWDTFKSMAKSITTIDSTNDENSIYGFASNSIDPIGMMFQQGGKLYNDNVTQIEFKNDDKMKNGLEFWRSLVTENAMRNPNSRANHGSIITSEFYSGKVGFLYTTSSNLKTITDQSKEQGFEIEVLPFPQQSQFFVNQGGSGIIILDNKPQAEQEAAADFMRWLSEPVQVAFMCARTGYLPVNKAAGDETALKDVYENYPTFKTVSDYMKFGIKSPQGTAKAAVDKKVNEYAKQIWSDPNKSIDEIINSLIEQAEYEIEANQ